jgi:predicted CXXCH cytochrome family protein
MALRIPPDAPFRGRWLLAGSAVSVALSLLVGLATTTSGETGSTQAVSDTPAAAQAGSYVPERVCAGCHAAEAAAWKDSHHFHAMEPPSPASVRGDFDDTVFEGIDGRFRFFQRDGSYFVETAGPDGKSTEFEIAYTFGWTPLQQYLVETDGGRLQALTVAWDTEANRWFDLPSEPTEPGDPLHWTGREYNWNFRCADCHSTDLKRNYDLETDTFDTTYSAVNVGCQACHGPGSGHLSWIAAGSGESDESRGFPVNFSSDPEREIGVCAQCHSRRRPITDHYEAGVPFLDQYVPELLSDGLYFADGQIDDEVYVYGSFLQSRMYRNGVTCSDCHDVHSGALRAQGNALCTACHNQTPPERFATIKPLAYDSPAHHFHAEGAPGSFCVDCHMPERTYMRVDPRRDHSFRVPRPDLDAATGAPDACTGCHTDRDPAWAADRIAEWYGPERRNEPHFGEVLALGRSGAPGAGTRLAEMIEDSEAPGIARATAVEMLQRYLDSTTAPVVATALDDPDPLVRLAAVEALAALPPDARLDLAAPRLEDSTRAVRIAAAHALAPVPPESFLGDRREIYQKAVDEFIASERAAAERPESHLNLGLYWTDQEDLDQAETEYRTALRLAPDFVPAMINLSALSRARGDGDAEAALLERAYVTAPRDPSVQHALGLLRVRQGRQTDALPLLAKAAAGAPENARYSYVYSVALDSLGRPDEAARVRDGALARHPYDIDLLVAALQSELRAGDRARARDTADRLLALRPDDAELKNLREQLEGN